CMMACVRKHYDGLCGVDGARLKVASSSLSEGKLSHRLYVCTACGLCIEACPKNALAFDEKGILRLERKLCNLCNECKEACPLGVVFMDENGYPQICDLCGGDPQCARWCKYDAVIVKPRKEVKAKAKEGANVS
ncbi:MAG: 4Fe-4S dicluster domain-containing protein, partial [Pseudomonadota bacterium]